MIYNLESLNRKLDKLSHVTALRAVAVGIKQVQGYAKEDVRVDHGELRDSIYTMVQQDGDITRGTCYTNKSYAQYVERGTGPRGQENHAGISPEMNPAYHQGPWWIHESQIDKRVAERSRWFYIDTPEGRFYQCTGQPARPFMYPALHSHKADVMKEMEKVIKRETGRSVR